MKVFEERNWSLDLFCHVCSLFYEWQSLLRSVVSFAIYWSEAELTNTFEREQPFVTEKERRMILGSITLS
jgi:hypothetical protein